MLRPPIRVFFVFGGAYKTDNRCAKANALIGNAQLIEFSELLSPTTEKSGRRGSHCKKEGAQNRSFASKLCKFCKKSDGQLQVD